LQGQATACRDSGILVSTIETVVAAKYVTYDPIVVNLWSNRCEKEQKIA